MTQTFRFLSFPVYQDARLYYQSMLLLANQLIKKRKYALSDQLRRSSLSVLLNIAEGSSKKSDKDFCRFLEIAIASLNETVACIDVLRIENDINHSQFLHFIKKAESIAKQIGGFIKKLRS